MSTGTHLLTAEQFAEMHFDVPVELVRGEIVYLYGEDGMTRPGMRHGMICTTVAAIFFNWNRRTASGQVVSNDSGVITERDPDTVRGPDVYFVSRDRLPVGPIPIGIPEFVPNLCVEVLSPSDRWPEVRKKALEYLDLGVTEVWIINPERKSLFVFINDDSPREFKGADQVESTALPGFSCPVSEFFEGV